MYNLSDKSNTKMVGHVKIIDCDTNEIIVNKRNAINYENMSITLAGLLASAQTESLQAFGISEMMFGVGGVTIDSIGTITYKPSNTQSTTSTLYNQTYAKSVANTVSVDPDNNVQVSHTNGTVYSDIIVTCTLDYAEPSGQDTSDLSSEISGSYIFNELGLKQSNGATLTHIVFHPVQKSANRKIQIIYTIRITVGS